MTLVTGCGWILGIHDPDPLDQVTPATCDELATPADGCLDWSPVHFSACGICAPSPPLVLDMPGEYLYDTDDEVLFDPDGRTIAHAGMSSSRAGVESWLISVDSVEIARETTLRAVGGRPLIIASWSDIVVSGTIDVSSHRGEARSGAGADVACGPAAGREGTSDQDNGAGGGGGGYQGRGGQGSRGAGTTSFPSAGGAGGVTLALPDGIRGGCPGASGGEARDRDLPGGRGGRGGGAVQLSAPGQIAITGRILANGAGGGPGRFAGGVRGSGGGGGGSGGHIAIDGGSITLDDAVITANGGGGGEGGDADEVGNPGGDGAASAQPAPGGADGASSGVDGGDGGSRNSMDGQSNLLDQAGGGGGGGGGVGYTITFTSDTSESNSTVSPDWFRIGLP